MKANYERQNDNKLSRGKANELSYFANIGKYLGLDTNALREVFIDPDMPKSERKKLKSEFNSIINTDYFRGFTMKEFDINNIYCTPIFKRLMNEDFWNNEFFQKYVDAKRFNPEYSKEDRKVIICESIVMLLYSYTSLSALFPDSVLLNFLTHYYDWLNYFFKEIAKTNNIFSDELDGISLCYQDAVSLASEILNITRDTWIYDYIIGLSARAIISKNEYPHEPELPTYMVDRLCCDNSNDINTIFSTLTLMLALMLHDKKSTVYIGNLPYHILTDNSNIPFSVITRVVFENFGKMFWHEEDTDNLIPFTKSKSNCNPEEWIYATNTVEKFEEVFNAYALLEKLNTEDLSDYIAYTITDLNTGIKEGNIYCTFKLDEVIDNYNKNDYLITKLLNLAPFHEKFIKEYEVFTSKHYKCFSDIVDYFLEYCPNNTVLYRKLESMPEEKQIEACAKLIGITMVGYSRYVDKEAKENYDKAVNIYITEHLKLKLTNLAIKQINDLTDDRIAAYYALTTNIFINMAENFRNLPYLIFINSTQANTIRTFTNGYIHVMNTCRKLLKQSNIDNKNLTDENEDIKAKNKQLKSDFNKLKSELHNKTKECDKLQTALEKSAQDIELAKQVELLKSENKKLKDETNKLNQTIDRQKTHIENIEIKQNNNQQYEQRIRQLEEENAEQGKLIKLYEEDEDSKELNEEEKYILANLHVDFTVLDCESTKRLQRTIMTNSTFNFVPRARGETVKMNLAANADIYVLATDRLSHSDSNRWRSQLSNKSFRCAYSPTCGFNRLCRIVLDKYYQMVEQKQIEPIK